MTIEIPDREPDFVVPAIENYSGKRFWIAEGVLKRSDVDYADGIKLARDDVVRYVNLKAFLDPRVQEAFEKWRYKDGIVDASREEAVLKARQHYVKSVVLKIPDRTPDFVVPDPDDRLDALVWVSEGIHVCKLFGRPEAIKVVDGMLYWRDNNWLLCKQTQDYYKKWLKKEHSLRGMMRYLRERYPEMQTAEHSQRDTPIPIRAPDFVVPRHGNFAEIRFWVAERLTTWEGIKNAQYFNISGGVIFDANWEDFYPFDEVQRAYTQWKKESSSLLTYTIQKPFKRLIRMLSGK